MMKTIGLLLSVLCIHSAQAEKLLVEPAQGTGIEKADLDSTTSLIRSAVTGLGHQLADKASNADAILKPELLKLGKSYILKISEIKGGATVSTSQLKAETIEEIDKVSERVTRAVLTQKQASEDAKVGDVTNQESHEGTQRRPVRNVTYVGVGTAMFSGMNTDGKIGYSFSFGKGWDSNNNILKIVGNFSGSGAATLFTGTLGGDYFLSMNNFAPYVGANFGYGISKADGDISSFTAKSGFILSPEVGVQVLRISETTIDLSFRAEYLLNSNEFGHPACYTLRVGLYY